MLRWFFCTVFFYGSAVSSVSYSYPSGFQDYKPVPWHRSRCHSCATHLYVEVVVLVLCELEKDGEEGEDGIGAEEGALGPDHRYRDQHQNHSQHPVEPAPQQALPVPLWKHLNIHYGFCVLLLCKVTLHLRKVCYINKMNYLYESLIKNKYIHLLRIPARACSVYHQYS